MARPPAAAPMSQVFAEIGASASWRATAGARPADGMSQAAVRSCWSHLARHGEASPAALARAFQLTKGAMTNTLQRLEAQGFVRVDGRRRGRPAQAGGAHGGRPRRPRRRWSAAAAID